MRTLTFIAASFLLFGCSEPNTQQDLERFISRTYAAAEVTATVLPPEPDFEPIAFAPIVDTDPFVMPSAQEDDGITTLDCWQPEVMPSKDPLERFELSSLKFKGVIGTPGSYWALVQSPDDAIHRIGPGRVLGSNRGRVDSVSPQTLSLTEHLPDGLGCWMKRNVKVAMVTEN